MSDVTSPQGLDALLSSIEPQFVSQRNVEAEMKGPNEHTVHEPDENEQRIIEDMKLRERASRTAFATDDSQRNVFLYNKMKAIAQEITGLLGE